MTENLRTNNVSEKYKFEWVAPERTGSRKVAEILNYYGFKCNGLPIHDGITVNPYTHRSISNEKYSDYKVICNTRNPYGRVYSLFKNFYHHFTDKSKEGFRKFLTQELPRLETINMVSIKKWDKPFDYIIRLEYMKEDLMKLPFILDVLTESQIDMILSHGKEIEDWEKFYDNEMKEMVYGYTEHQFKLWGYDK
jgi:hypothetical protein